MLYSYGCPPLPDWICTEQNQKNVLWHIQEKLMTYTFFFVNRFLQSHGFWKSGQWQKCFSHVCRFVFFQALYSDSEFAARPDCLLSGTRCTSYLWVNEPPPAPQSLILQTHTIKTKWVYHFIFIACCWRWNVFTPVPVCECLCLWLLAK